MSSPEPGAEAGGAAGTDGHAPQRASGFAFFVAAGIFLSRIAGLLRQSVLSYFLGTSAAMSAFQAALRIPNFLQNLLGEGVLSASMIPVYARLLAEDDEEMASRVAGVVVSLLALLVVVVVAGGIVFAPLLVDVLAAGYEGEIRTLTIHIVRILFPGVGLLVLSAWCLAVLNSHRRFFIPYVAPVLWNVAIIAALLLFAAGELPPTIAVIAGWGAVVGSLLQLGVQVPFVLRALPRLRLGLDATLAPVRQVFRNFVPVVVGRGVVQVSAFLDELFASFLGPAAMGALGYAYLLYLLPFSLFGMSVSAAELPQMSAAVGSTEDVRAQLRERLRRGLGQIAFFVVPSVVAFVFIGDSLVAAVYQRGRFGTGSTLYVWYILAGYAVGLLPATLARLYASVFYALNDTRTPLRFALVRVTLTALAGFLLAFPLRTYLVTFLTDVLGMPLPEVAGGALALGALGLAGASGIVSWVELALLRRALAKRTGELPANAAFQVRVWASAFLGATVALGIRHAFGSPLADAVATVAPPLEHVALALAVIVAFVGPYLALTFAFGLDESRRLCRRVARVVRR